MPLPDAEADGLIAQGRRAPADAMVAEAFQFTR